jgi:hypothetical protein
MTETQTCDTGVACPVNCVFSVEQEWTPTCNGEECRKIKNYNIDTPDSNGGAECIDGDYNITNQGLIRNESCDDPEYCKNCEGEWSDWGPCTIDGNEDSEPVLCARDGIGGSRMRTYTITQEKGTDGNDCLGDNGEVLNDGYNEYDTCNNAECPETQDLEPSPSPSPSPPPETPQTETPQTETPQTETPQTETPQSGSSAFYIVIPSLIVSLMGYLAYKYKAEIFEFLNKLVSELKVKLNKLVSEFKGNLNNSK